MGLLENKGWVVQEIFNEYLELKTDISERVRNLEDIKRFGNVTDIGIKIKEDKINEKVKRFKCVLNNLKFQGISMEDLILLSIGIDV